MCFDWLTGSLAVIWYVTVLHKSFVFPHAESVASRIKPGLLFQGVTPPSHTSTNQFHYDHRLIWPSVPDRHSPGRREMPRSKSNWPSPHPFPCLPSTSKVPLWAVLNCLATDNICAAIVMEDYVTSSLSPFLGLLLSLLFFSLLSEFTKTNIVKQTWS